MEQTSDGQVLLASKWDIPLAVFWMLRALFGTMPLWVKLTLFGIIGSVAVWTAITWLRDRSARAT
ncbi:hypothetical protein [Streptomyces sp. NPDC091371]|uniref:hypothetical protein n=1 Tax=Streptomyces sp. NPDC091371 TaxID=3155303 RepID=UPI00343CE9A1